MTREGEKLLIEIRKLERRLIGLSTTGGLRPGAHSPSHASAGSDPITNLANSQLADMDAARIKGRASGAGTGAPQDLTGTQATVILDVMVGDSGAGGTKGLVPAPAAGDAAAAKFLKADGTFAVPSGVATTRYMTVGCVIDGGGSVITTGIKGFVRVHAGGTIIEATVLSIDAAGPATAGDIVVDVWKDTYANFPPTVADTITASAKPTLSGANKSTDTTLTGWTTAVSAGDVFGFKVDSVTTVTKVLVLLKVQLT